MNKKEREKNIKGAYKLEKCKNLEGKKILLLDDVYTTGSTVNECCKTIKQANIKEISVFTIAKD